VSVFVCVCVCVRCMPLTSNDVETINGLNPLSPTSLLSPHLLLRFSLSTEVAGQTKIAHFAGGNHKPLQHQHVPAPAPLLTNSLTVSCCSCFGLAHRKEGCPCRSTPTAPIALSAKLFCHLHFVAGIVNDCDKVHFNWRLLWLTLGLLNSK